MAAENGEGDKEDGVDATKSEEELREKEPAPDPRDVIVITGRAENCERAKQSLLVSSWTISRKKWEAKQARK